MALMMACFAGHAAHAGVFDEADALFEQRETGGTATVAAARAEYLRIAENATGASLAHAVQQIGKLAIFEGLYLLPNTSAQRARRAAIFNECRALAQRLDGNDTYITQYAYWRATCNALWVKDATLTDRLAQIGEIKRNFNRLVGDDLEVRPELGIDLRYQGGGLPRTLAGIYTNSLSSLLRDGLPNQDKAVAMSDRALRSQAFPGDANGGLSFYSNHRIKAEALIGKGDRTGARALLEQTIEEIDELEAEDELPAGIEPEARGERAIMQALLDTL
jgi:hypothetical protein